MRSSCAWRRATTRSSARTAPSSRPANTLTFSLANSATGLVPTGAAITAGGAFTWTPTEAQGPGTVTFDVVVMDNGSPNLSARETIIVTVNEINAAPAGTNKTITINEDAPYTLSLADFGFTDPLDSPANSFQAVTITTLPGTGTLTLNDIPVNAGDLVSPPEPIPAGAIWTAREIGRTWTSIASSADGMKLIAGTSGQLYTSVQVGLVFTPALNASGTGVTSFTFQVQDNGGRLNSGVDLDPMQNTITVNVTAVNDAPVLGTSSTLSYTENQAATAINTTLSVTDVDNTTLASATVQLTANYQNGQDVLGFTSQLGITGSFVAGTGTLTLTGSTTVANYQTALRTVTYQNTSEAPSILARTVVYQVNDGGAVNNLSNQLTSTINVTAVNDAPLAVNDAYTVIQDTTLTVGTVLVKDIFPGSGYGQPSGLINVNGTLFFGAIDGVNGQELWASGTAANVLANDTDSDSATLAANLVTGPANGTLVLNADGTFTYRPNAGFTGTDSFTYQANDGSLLSNVATVTITVTA